ncbi:DUF192 domain-containing protein [Aminobacter sp. MSH1]|uniref:DUF192 domain-containing protein n=1 Tax=Aminobacter sp. MSH1 TaxID=374606 RepID=UPI00131F0098|nr:DUF192 domain-containing protein [Aminobacter sp. MSH1]
MALAPARASADQAEVCDLYFSGGVVVRSVPVAKTVAAQSQGLSGRDDIGAGLLFSWPTAEPRVFWMRDTRVALTVGYFDADGVLFAQEDMEPMTDTYHFSVRPATDALELAQGDFGRLGLSVGSRLDRRECRTPQ